VALLLLGLAALVVRRPPAAGFALLAATIVLLPADLVVPNGYSPLPTVTRVVVLAAAAGLLLSHRQAFAVTPVHLAAALFALATLVTGVALAPTGVRPRDAALDWVSLVEPLAVFVVALGALRATEYRPLAMRVLGRVTVAAVVIAVLERALGISWGQLVGGIGGPLEMRAGESRVRVGSEFALAFAWTVGALVPTAIVAARRRGPLTELAVFTGCLLAAYWSFSRSAPLAFAVGIGVLIAADRDRRLAVGAAATAVGLASVFAFVPTVSDRFATAVDPGAIAVRTERLPILLEAAAQRPLQGIALSGTDRLGVSTTDNAFVLAYVETGVLGAALLVFLLGCGLVCAARGLCGPAGPDRTTCAAAVAGALVLVTGGVVFDSLQVRGTADLLWLLLAVGVAASERTVGRQALPRPWRDVPLVRVALVAGALAAGVVWSYAAPSHTAVTVTFETLPPARLTGFGDPVDEGRRLIGTTCAVAEVYAARDDGVSLDCRDLNGPSGVGELRAQAADVERATQALVELRQLVVEQTRVRSLTFRLVTPPQTGRPTVARTAPVWLPLSMLLFVLFVPSGPLRRLESRLADPRGWSRRVDGQDVGPRASGQVGAELGLPQDGRERRGEPVDV